MDTAVCKNYLPLLQHGSIRMVTHGRIRVYSLRKHVYKGVLSYTAICHIVGLFQVGFDTVLLLESSGDTLIKQQHIVGQVSELMTLLLNCNLL